MRSPRRLITLACCAVGVLIWSMADTAHVAHAVPTTGHTIALAPGRMPIADLIASLAPALGVRVDVSPQAATVSLLVADATARDATRWWAWLHERLAQAGLTTVVSGDAMGLVVVPLALAANTALVELPGTSLPTSVTMHARFAAHAMEVPARLEPRVIERLSALVSPGMGQVRSLRPGSGVVILADYRVRLAQLSEYAARVGHEDAQGPAWREVAVQNMPAAAMATLATQVASRAAKHGGSTLAGEVMPAPHANSVLVIAPPESQQAWAELLARLDQRPTLETRAYAAPVRVDDAARLVRDLLEAAPAADSRARVLVDASQGVLVVSTTAQQHEHVRALLDELAAQPADAIRQLRIVRVVHRPVDEIVGVVRSLLRVGGLDAMPPTGSLPQPPRTATDGAAGTTPPIAAFGAPRPTPGSNELHLTVDPASNAILAVGPAPELDRLATLVASLDQRQPQVMLEVMLISLSKNDAKTLGIELDRLTSLGDATRVRLASLFGLASTASPSPPAAGPGGTAVVLSPGEFSALLRAVQTSNAGRSASMPRVLVNNNQRVTLSSVLQQPFTTATSNSGGVAQGFGGTQDAGTTIALRPTIGAGDELVVEYTLSLSSFVGGPTGPGLPPPR